MSQFLVRGHLQCVLLCGMMATLAVLFSNIRGYHQGLSELSVCLMSTRPDFVADSRSFLGTISVVWSIIPLTLRERGAVEGWSAVCHLLQRHLTDV